jgi:hypothetical protein
MCMCKATVSFKGNINKTCMHWQIFPHKIGYLKVEYLDEFESIFYKGFNPCIRVKMTSFYDLKKPDPEVENLVTTR